MPSISTAQRLVLNGQESQFMAPLMPAGEYWLNKLAIVPCHKCGSDKIYFGVESSRLAHIYEISCVSCLSTFRSRYNVGEGYYNFFDRLSFAWNINQPWSKLINNEFDRLEVFRIDPFGKRETRFIARQTPGSINIHSPWGVHNADPSWLFLRLIEMSPAKWSQHPKRMPEKDNATVAAILEKLTETDCRVKQITYD